MAKVEKARYQSFHILNVKLRKTTSQKDLAPEDYVRIIKRVYNKKIHASSSRGKHIIIKFLFEEKEKGKTIYLSGTIAQFTYIENERWFNLNKLDLDNEFRLPDGLFPDAVITDFVFIPEAHRFCFRKASGINISPYPVKNFLEKAIDQVTNKDEYAQVDVETDKSTINKILKAYVKQLSIDINYSNVDISGPLKEFVEKDIKASNTSRLQLKATHKPDTSIDIEESKILTGALEAAASNGEAEAIILDKNNRTQVINTTSFPRKETVYGVMSRFNQLVYEKVMQIFRPKK